MGSAKRGGLEVILKRPAAHQVNADTTAATSERKTAVEN
jgi:hypothetical protein